MEKRTVLAVALSFLVLIVYNALFIKKQDAAKKPTIISQPIYNNKVSDLINTKEALKVETAVPSKVEISSEKLETIENKELIVEISNIGAVVRSVIIKDQKHKIPLANILDVPALSSVQFSAQKTGNDSIIFSGTVKDVKISKSFRISGSTLETSMSVRNAPEMSKLRNLNFNVYSIDTSSMTEKDVGYADRSLFEYSASSSGSVFRKHNASAFSKKEAKMHVGQVDWIGFRDRFYCAVFKPLFTIENYEIDPKSDKLLNLYLTPANDVSDNDVEQEYKFIAYFGRQNESVLKTYNSGFEQIVSFSNFGIIDGISKLIIKMMQMTHKIIPNWGIAIIVTCVFVYMLMYPLTMQGMKSMRKMQSLQPEMTKMREQYKNNPQRLNKEVMEIYKKNSVNPLGGCFPFILQMPVFIGLYQALWRNPDLCGANFLWIKDLSAPDRLFLLPNSLPFIGNEFNILPLFMMVVMFFQQKLSTKNIVITDPVQISQQKIMSIFFPIMLGFIFYKFSSGLTLYFTIFYLFSTFTQWKMSKVKIEVIS